MRFDNSAAQRKVRLALAEFVAREIAEAVVGGIFVGFAEGGIVEDLLNELVDGQPFIKNYHTDVDEFGGGLSDHADAQQLAICPVKDQLQHPSSIACNVAAGVVFVVGAADAVIDALLFAGLFGFPGSGDFRNGVNAHGQQRGHARLVLEAERVADGDTSLLHGCGGQRRKPDDVASGVDVRQGCAVILIDRDVAPIINGQSGFVQRQTVNRRTTACSKQGRLHFQNLPALHEEACTGRIVFNLEWTLLKPEVHAEGEKPVAQTVGNFGVEKRQQLIATINQGHIDSQGHEDRSVLTTDYTATDDGQTLRNVFHAEKGVGVEGMDVVESNFGGTMGFGTRGDQDDLGAESTCSLGAADNHGVSILEGSLATKKFNLVKFEILEDTAAFHLHNSSFVVHEIVNS